MTIGAQVFSQLMTPPTTAFQHKQTISSTAYNQWKKEFTWEALQGQRYGQNFCNRFEITDNILHYERDPEWCDAYIKKHYIFK
jgi:hypothetical protein